MCLVFIGDLLPWLLELVCECGSDLLSSAYIPAMSIDTTVLDTSMAVTPDLAWSLDGDDAVLDFPADQSEPDDDEQIPDERYGWGEVWRNAVLLVVVAAALAVLAAVLTSMRENHESAAAPAPAPPPSTPSVGQTWQADSVFLTELGNAGIVIPVPSTPEAIEVGHQVCADLGGGGGLTPQQEIQVLVAPPNSSVTPEVARKYVAAATDAYCPQSATRH